MELLRRWERILPQVWSVMSIRVASWGAGSEGLGSGVGALFVWSGETIDRDWGVETGVVNIPDWDERIVGDRTVVWGRSWSEGRDFIVNSVRVTDALGSVDARFVQQSISERSITPDFAIMILQFTALYAIMSSVVSQISFAISEKVRDRR